MKKMKLLQCLATGMGLWLAFTTLEQAADIWVSPSGNDGNSGSQEAPVATLAQATVLERKARLEDPKSPVTVWLAAGDYPVEEGWALGPEDSGAAGSPVIWRSVEKGKARLVGCRSIASENWKPLNDPDLLARLSPKAVGRIMQLDVAAVGLHPAQAFPDYSAEPPGRFVLFSDDKRLPLSRWPNGAYGYTTMDHVLENGGPKGSANSTGVFVYRGDEPERWSKALEDGGVWIRGFWRVPWVAETLRVSAIDPTSKTITLGMTGPSGIGSKYSKLENGVRTGDGKENWFAVNLLEEIDEPGEWAVDFKRNRIYLWPPTGCKINISDNTGPLITLKDASHLELHDLALGWTLGDGLRIEGGDHVRLVGCDLHQIGRRAVAISGGKSHSILDNNIYDIGLSAIDVTGGDRITLTPCGDEIDNNLISRVALDGPIPAIIVGLDAHHQNAIGIHVAHNRIDGASNGGVSFTGNDNIFEYNEIYRVGLDSGDLGAFYTTGGWTSRGNIVRYNFIHHSANANGVYMDDGDCGLQVYGNLIYKVNSALFIGGGHDNILDNNLIVDCERAAHIDDRGLSRKYSITDSRLRGDFDSVPTQTPPWSEKYPILVNWLKTDTRIPSGDVLENNIAVACGTFIRKSGKPENLTGYEIKDNGSLADIGIFTAPDELNFTIRDPNVITQVVPAFRPIPLDQMGLQLDAYRTTIPPRDMDELKDENSSRRTFDSQQDVDSSRKAP